MVTDRHSKTMHSCLVCGGNLEPATRLPGLVQCTNCSFVTTDFDITDDELERLYGHDYFHGSEYLDYNAESESLRLNFKRRIIVLRTLMPELKSAELFEIGCAFGFFLQEVRPYVGSASGIDISSDAIVQSVGEQMVDAKVADYLSLSLSRPVDIIAMWDTIEHLRRPDLFVAKAARDIRPGGLIAITTGDIGSLNAFIRGKGWRMIHPPTHLHYFSVDTLCRLLTRNGFEIVHVSHPGNSRKLRSMLYFLTVLKAKRPTIYNALHGMRLFDFSITLNLFDIMYVVGRKRGGAKL